MKLRHIAVLATLLLATSLPAVVSGQVAQLLRPEEAFPVSAVRTRNGEVLVMFDVARGYALYKDRISIRSASPLHDVIKPKGIPHNDEYFGYQEKYRTSTTIRVIPDRPGAPIVLYVKSQGCADIGVCFNPTTVRLNLP